VRKQYHFRRSGEDVLIWDCDRLVELSAGLSREMIRVESIRELDEPYWGVEDGGRMTCREVVEHMRLTQQADLSFPIILSAGGRVMDGMHRVAKAALEGRERMEAVRFSDDPEPDYVNVKEADLPY
jgi:hypothetical protein